MAWKVLVADDNEDTWGVVRACLRKFAYRGLAADVLWAATASEAEAILHRDSDIALALVDVVMESPTAGLDLIERIRQEGRIWRTRVVLLTGNPDVAPRSEATQQFDLDGYIDKAQMTPERLYATTYSAVRAYDLISRLDRARKSIVDAVTMLQSKDQRDVVARSLTEALHSITQEETIADSQWEWGSVAERPKS